MKRETVEKIIVTLVLVLWYVLAPQVGYTDDAGDIAGHLLYPLSHVNMWHLAGNLFVWWLLSKRLYLIQSLVIAVAASWMPSLPGLWDIWQGAQETAVTMGFSGVLFAIIGVKWGVVCKQRTETFLVFCRRMLPFAILGFFIPHVNWAIHTYCLLIGLAYGRWKR